MNVMEIRGLCKAYPAFTLKDVSFTVPQGAVMGFIGRNGAGKSTTIKSVLGLVHPDAGQVEILGRSFSGGEKFIKENIGVVLGGIDFYPKKTIATLTVNCTPFVRQYGILLGNGVFFYAKGSTEQTIHSGIQKTGDRNHARR